MMTNRDYKRPWCHQCKAHTRPQEKWFSFTCKQCGTKMTRGAIMWSFCIGVLVWIGLPILTGNVSQLEYVLPWLFIPSYVLIRIWITSNKDKS